MQLRGEIRSQRPLLVFALEEEAAHLDGALPVLLTGVGKANAAAVVAATLAVHQPAVVVNLGTAGGLRPEITGTWEIGSVTQHDLDDETLYALTGRRFAPQLHLAEQGPTLATGDVFVSDPLARQRLAASAELVDMEGYAVAMAARNHQVPVRLVKHVSDSADDTAARSWRDSVDACAHTLARWVETHL